jgi:type I restriction enzyme R subunit
MDGNEEIFGKLMSDGEFRQMAMDYLLHKVYGALKERNEKAAV